MTQTDLTLKILEALDEDYSINPDHMSDHDRGLFWELLSSMIDAGRTDLDAMIIELHNWYLPAMKISTR